MKHLVEYPLRNRMRMHNPAPSSAKDCVQVIFSRQYYKAAKQPILTLIVTGAIGFGARSARPTYFERMPSLVGTLII